MPAEQLDFEGNAVPFPPLEPRAVGRGARGGSVEAAKIPDKPERYVEMLGAFYFRGAFGWTDSELAHRFAPIHRGTLSKRRLRLERAGLLEETPGRRLTHDGVPAIIFVITDKGRAVLAEWQKQ